MTTPDFTIDLAYGEEGEHHVLADLGSSSWEVKRKKIVDDRFYLEMFQHPYMFQCEGDCPKRIHWYTSGLLSTQAQHIAFMVDTTDVWIHLPAQRLQKLLRWFREEHWEGHNQDCEPLCCLPGFAQGGTRGTNPTVGVILSLQQILELI